MLIEVSKDVYRRNFSADPNPYISEAFIGLVENKTDKVIRLMMSNDTSMGLIAGLKDKELCAPFSAPFGGFHYTHEHFSYEVVYDFIAGLKDYLREQGQPNIGLIRFKEIHNCATSLKYTFSWSTQDELNATNSENYATKT